jgi:hypothetical protein
MELGQELRPTVDVFMVLHEITILEVERGDVSSQHAKRCYIILRWLHSALVDVFSVSMNI